MEQRSCIPACIPVCARALRDASASAFLAIPLAIPLLIAGPAEARVTRIVIDATTALTGQAIPYEQIRGRAFGELDPSDVHNAIITDIQLGKDADGKVRYETSFVLTKPVDVSATSGFMWHDVPNRGGGITIAAAERSLGDIGLASGWQADNAGGTAGPVNRSVFTNHWVAVPYARNPDGSPVTARSSVALSTAPASRRPR